MPVDSDSDDHTTSPKNTGLAEMQPKPDVQNKDSFARKRTRKQSMLGSLIPLITLTDVEKQDKKSTKKPKTKSNSSKKSRAAINALFDDLLGHDGESRD